MLLSGKFYLTLHFIPIVLFSCILGYWKVGATPPQSNSFYSPWFGIDASDNLNLLQPVNPWMGNEWLIYNEYFQWSPEVSIRIIDEMSIIRIFNDFYIFCVISNL